MRTALIIKTSSLGDIVQAFNVLDYMHSKWPGIEIDWLVDSSLAAVVAAHPLIATTIPIELKGLKKFPGTWPKLVSSISQLRKKKYDALFDLQGNCKSGILTLFCRAKDKVGFGWNTVREKPNVLATNLRFEVSHDLNIRQHYVKLIQNYRNISDQIDIQGVRFKVDEEENLQVQAILASPSLERPMKIMVCPGSKWSNKQLPLETMRQLLRLFDEKFHPSFLLMWGAEAEKNECIELARSFPKQSLVVEKLSIPAWQNLMNEMHLVLAVDSSALHLAGTTQTRSFSLFGPSSPSIFKPIGARHGAYRGACPYGKTFSKTCPALRTCPTGACLRNLSAAEIFEHFIQWWGVCDAVGLQR